MNVPILVNIFLAIFTLYVFIHCNTFVLHTLLKLMHFYL